MLSGSLAMGAYTMPRMTRDIDIVIDLDLDDMDSFCRFFGKFLHQLPSAQPMAESFTRSVI